MESKKKVAQVLKTGVSELGEFSARRYALFGATIAGLVFEWSPANEAVLGAIGVSAHEQLGTGGSITHAVVDRLATGAITGASSFIEQFSVGALTALSVKQFPKTFKVWQDSRPENAIQSVSTSSSAMTALALGSSMAVVEKQIIDKSTTHKDNLVLVAKTSAVVGGFNTILAGAVSGGLEILDRAGQHGLSENIADTVKNPLLYIGLFGLAKFVSYKKDKKTNINEAK